MLDRLISSGELILLLFLTILQFGRWAQKTQTEPEKASRLAREALAKAQSNAAEVRRLKRAWDNRFTENDRVYARKREVELELQNIKTKQDSDCDRISSLEEHRRTGV